MTARASDRPIYTEDQLQQYFDYIGLPEASRRTRDGLQTQGEDQKLWFLAELKRYQLCAVPFENLDLHYSTVKGVSIDTDHLFHKIVERRAGRGGYCMQNNSFFATILRTLGYQLFSAGARVASGLDEDAARNYVDLEAAFGGYGHQVNIVTIGSQKWFVDVGFGSTGPTFPIPLVNGFTRVNTGTIENPATHVRLHRGFTANNTSRSPEQELWIYSIKFGDLKDEAHPWIQTYCFNESEFFPSDFNVLSHTVSTSRTSMFVNNIVCSKFLQEKHPTHNSDVVIGDVQLWNKELKIRRWGKSEQPIKIESEQDRIKALEEYMGIKLSTPEVKGIVGLPTQIP